MIADPLSDAQFYEINISCPNAQTSKSKKKFAGLDDLIDLDFRTLDKPFGIKLPPLFAEKDIWNCVKRLNLLSKVTDKFRYIVCSNTIPRGCINNSFVGSLSGGYLKPIALWNIMEIRKLLVPSIGIIGCGGISSVDDIRSYISNGCVGVQIASAFIQEGPQIFNRLKREMNTL
jgi:dihydroorotate dehydrogenase